MHGRKLFYVASIVPLIISFVGSSLYIPQAYGAEGLNLPFMPNPGVRVDLSPEFTPAELKGITIHPENPLMFDFIIYKGDKVLSSGQKPEEYKKLIKYFLASLAIPDEDQWVNLSPYEKDRIIQDDFGKTLMGRDLLSQDYILKQITASLIYPEKGLGKKFWENVYAKAQEQYGTTNIPVNTFNKVWIIPDNALIYEKGNTAYVLKNHLKVMLEEDYLSLSRHSEGVRSTTEESKGALRSFANAQDDKAHTIGSQAIREIILPALEKEVNEGKNFAMLRQVYSGMLLAAWFKRTLKESILGRIYADKTKLKGVDQNPMNNEAIYQRYLGAYKKGVFNYIKEDVDRYTNQPVPRKYFSGGTVGYGLNEDMAQLGRDPISETTSLTPAEDKTIAAQISNEDLAQVSMDKTTAPNDQAMRATEFTFSDGKSYSTIELKNITHLIEIVRNELKDGPQIFASTQQGDHYTITMRSFYPMYTSVMLDALKELSASAWMKNHGISYNFYEEILNDEGTFKIQFQAFSQDNARDKRQRLRVAIVGRLENMLLRVNTESKDAAMTAKYWQFTKDMFVSGDLVADWLKKETGLGLDALVHVERVKDPIPFKDVLRGIMADVLSVRLAYKNDPLQGLIVVYAKSSEADTYYGPRSFANPSIKIRLTFDPKTKLFLIVRPDQAMAAPSDIALIDALLGNNLYQDVNATNADQWANVLVDIPRNDLAPSESIALADALLKNFRKLKSSPETNTAIEWARRHLVELTNVALTSRSDEIALAGALLRNHWMLYFQSKKSGIAIEWARRHLVDLTKIRLKRSEEIALAGALLLKNFEISIKRDHENLSAIDWARHRIVDLTKVTKMIRSDKIALAGALLSSKGKLNKNEETDNALKWARQDLVDLTKVKELTRQERIALAGVLLRNSLNLNINKERARAIDWARSNLLDLSQKDLAMANSSIEDVRKANYNYWSSERHLGQGGFSGNDANLAMDKAKAFNQAWDGLSEEDRKTLETQGMKRIDIQELNRRLSAWEARDHSDWAMAAFLPLRPAVQQVFKKFAVSRMQSKWQPRGNGNYKDDAFAYERVLDGLNAFAFPSYVLDRENVVHDVENWRKFKTDFLKSIDRIREKLGPDTVKSTRIGPILDDIKDNYLEELLYHKIENVLNAITGNEPMFDLSLAEGLIDEYRKLPFQPSEQSLSQVLASKESIFGGPSSSPAMTTVLERRQAYIAVLKALVPENFSSMTLPSGQTVEAIILSKIYNPDDQNHQTLYKVLSDLKQKIGFEIFSKGTILGAYIPETSSKSSIPGLAATVRGYVEYLLQKDHVQDESVLLAGHSVDITLKADTSNPYSFFDAAGRRLESFRISAQGGRIYEGYLAENSPFIKDELIAYGDPGSSFYAGIIYQGGLNKLTVKNLGTEIISFGNESHFPYDLVRERILLHGESQEFSLPKGRTSTMMDVSLENKNRSFGLTIPVNQGESKLLRNDIRRPSWAVQQTSLGNGGVLLTNSGPSAVIVLQRPDDNEVIKDDGLKTENFNVGEPLTAVVHGPGSTFSHVKWVPVTFESRDVDGDAFVVKDEKGKLLKLSLTNNINGPKIIGVIRKDRAMGAINPGGIDLNSANLDLQIKRDGLGVPLPLAQQDLASLSDIEGLDPVILSIKPASQTPLLSQLQTSP